ncbi:MAG: hypothetical protein RIR96_139 [Bacteroidota bacterium]
MEKLVHESIEDYVKSLTPAQSARIKEIIDFLGALFPDAEQKISYNMPSFHLNGPLVYVAAYKNHIGFYPTPGPIIAFKDELVDYKTSKGAIQFPINKPFPFELIESMLEFRKKELIHKKKK